MWVFNDHFTTRALSHTLIVGNHGFQRFKKSLLQLHVQKLVKANLSLTLEFLKGLLAHVAPNTKQDGGHVLLELLDTIGAVVQGFFDHLTELSLFNEVMYELIHFHRTDTALDAHKPVDASIFTPVTPPATVIAVFLYLAGGDYLLSRIKF